MVAPVDEPRRWTLLDTEAGLEDGGFSLARAAPDLAPPAGLDATSRLLVGGVSHGVQLIEVASNDLSFTVIPTRGMGLWKGSYRGIPLTWGSPVAGPVHPRHVELSLGGGRGWLGGFDEWAVRCGLSSNGVPGVDAWVDDRGTERTETLTQHGRIANVPAHRAWVEVEAGPPFRIRVVGEVLETAFFGPRLLLRTTYEHVPGTGVLSITDEVGNLGGQTAELQLLYHLNFGAPLVGDGARIRVAADEIAPYTSGAAAGILDYATCVAPAAGRPEEVFLCVPRADADGYGAALLESGGGDSGVLVRFDRATLPWFVIWKLLGDPRDGYVVGLEPGTNFPNLRTFERSQGRVQRLEPGETRTFRVSMELLAGAGEVGAARSLVDIVQGPTVPRLRRSTGLPFTAG
jgi:galactose mutarotase-like enzyme